MELCDFVHYQLIYQKIKLKYTATAGSVIKVLSIIEDTKTWIKDTTLNDLYPNKDVA